MIMYIVDNNLFEDVRLLQTGLSSLSDTLLKLLRAYLINMQIQHHFLFYLIIMMAIQQKIIVIFQQ